MNFTFNDYKKLIDNLRCQGYEFTNYHDYRNIRNPCILRHDVDYSLEKSNIFAEFEKSIGVKSTYFVLLSSDFYNLLSKNNIEILNHIKAMGHEIGLHFDEVKYGSLDSEEMIYKIKEECEVLSQITGDNIRTVSMHRPSKWVLEADLKIPGIINSYGTEFFHDFKYVSDSRMRWREDIMNYVKEKAFPRFHILTHAFWYSKKEKDIHDILESFLDDSRKERYRILNDNFSDLSSVIKE